MFWVWHSIVLVFLSDLVFTVVIHLLLHALRVVDLLLSSHEVWLGDIMWKVRCLSEILTTFHIVVVHMCEIWYVLRWTWLASSRALHRSGYHLLLSFCFHLPLLERSQMLLSKWRLLLLLSRSNWFKTEIDCIYVIEELVERVHVHFRLQVNLIRQISKLWQVRVCQTIVL